MLINWLPVQKQQLSAMSNQYPLHFAARNGDLKTITGWVADGANLDQARSPLGAAAATAAVSVLPPVLAPHLTSPHVPSLLQKDHLGRTPLHLAAWAGQLDAVKALVVRLILQLLSAAYR